MRRASRVDKNQPQIVSDLRAAGCTVRSLAGVGKGCPDLLVGYARVNYLFEVKDPAQAPSARTLTPLEQEFFDEWRGQVNKIETAEDALRIMGLMK